MNVNPATAKHVHEHGTKTYYFCCAGCAEKFKGNPETYLNKPASSGLVMLGMPAAPKASSADGLAQPEPAHNATPAYVCPMCPEVREAKPGACPSCGMALEPEVPLSTTRTEYTCPMHPQIVRPGPGSCPICGMTLEPRTVTASSANPELTSMTRRLWVGAALTLPLLAVMVSDVASGHPLQHLLPGSLLGWLELILATPVVLWGG